MPNLISGCVASYVDSQTCTMSQPGAGSPTCTHLGVAVQKPIPQYLGAISGGPGHRACCQVREQHACVVYCLSSLSQLVWSSSISHALAATSSLNRNSSRSQNTIDPIESSYQSAHAQSNLDSCRCLIWPSSHS